MKQRNSETGDAGNSQNLTKNPDNFRRGIRVEYFACELFRVSQILRDEFAQIVRHILVLRFDLFQILHANTKPKKLA